MKSSRTFFIPSPQLSNKHYTLKTGKRQTFRAFVRVRAHTLKRFHPGLNANWLRTVFHALPKAKNAKKKHYISTTPLAAINLPVHTLMGKTSSKTNSVKLPTGVSVILSSVKICNTEHKSAHRGAEQRMKIVHRVIL